MKPGLRILLADDDPCDVELFLLGLEKVNLAGFVDVVDDGEGAMDYLLRQGPFQNRKNLQPAVVFLDLQMPKMNGQEVLKRIKADPNLRHIPVVAFTSSQQERDLRECYANGVNAYVVKPLDFENFMGAVEALGSFWTSVNKTAPMQ